MSPTPRRSIFNRPISLLLAQQLICGIVTAPAFTFFPVYLKDLGWSAIAISWTSTVQRLAGLASSLVGGRIFDALGSKRTFMLGQACFFASAALFFCRDPISVGVVWALCGFGIGLSTIGGQAYLIQNANPSSLGVLAAFYHWGTTVGGAAVNPVAGFLQERSGYSILSTAAVLPAAAAIILMSILLPKAPLVQAKPKRPRDFLGYGDLAGRPEMLLLGVLRFLPTYGYGIAGIFVPLVLRSAGASNTFIALYATVSSLSASAAQLIVGRIADTYNWKWPTIGSFLVLALGSLTIALFPASLVAVFLGAVALIAAAWALATLMPTLVSKVAKPEEQGRVLSFAHLFWNLAMISGSVSGGFLYQAHPGFPFAAGALAAAAAMLAAARFFRLADSAIAAAKKEA